MQNFLFPERIRSLCEVIVGEAKVVKFEDKSYALYKEIGRIVYLAKGTCPHAKCEIWWNSAVITGDCPCHGSRFNSNGKILNDPVVKDLQRIDV